jgi:ribosome-interacting GTPase 1
MPANLPPQYFETERKLKTAKTTQEKIKIYEELLSIVPKHKGTEKLQALLKAKIAKFKSDAQKKPSIAKHSPTHRIERAGAGQLILVGPPNVGKSMLLKSLTNAQPEIGDYPFTTRIPSPAMMLYENIQIQLIDSPPITPEYMEVWYPELIKGSDGILFILDSASSGQAELFQTLREKLIEKKIEMFGKSPEINAEEKLFQKKTLIIANKIDLPQAKNNLPRLQEALAPIFPIFPVSAIQGDNLSELKKKIYLFLDILRVYSKSPGKKVEYNEPFTFKRGSKLMDMAKAVHKDFAEKLKYARIWGKNKYQGQKVNRDYILEDEDVIELHI